MYKSFEEKVGEAYTSVKVITTYTLFTLRIYVFVYVPYMCVVIRLSCTLKIA